MHTRCALALTISLVYAGVTGGAAREPAPRATDFERLTPAQSLWIRLPP